MLLEYGSKGGCNFLPIARSIIIAKLYLSKFKRGRGNEYFTPIAPLSFLRAGGWLKRSRILVISKLLHF